MAWLAGCGIMSIRLLGQWLDLQRITRPCTPVAEANIQAILARLQKMLGMNQGIRILSGNQITGPSVYGMIAPTLLLPPALLLGVPAEQLEAIIAHELAHIRRHDYLVNLAQQVVEAALFFNPAVWWINRQIRIEREACCDQLAVAVTGKREAYAWSLKTWAEKQREAAVLLAPAFGAERHPSGPLERLKRLLVSEYRPAVRLPWHSFAGVLLVGGVLFFGLSQGTRLAVGYAAELLTPAQRLEKLDEIK
jgi:beta-lactamase regulating signal transducer with metallopeptidase domain